VAASIDIDRAREELAREGIETEIVSIAPRCLRARSGRISASSLVKSGLLHPQDAGSQLVPLLLDIQRSDRVLDVCAAPGGKAAVASDLAGEDGRVIAVERRRGRMRLLREIASRTAGDRIRFVLADGRKLPFRARFARILLDVPCTSLGTLRRNPDIKWRIAPEDPAELAVLQLELLRSAAALLSEGGRLVYATCSTEPEENECVIEQFLSESKDFRRIPAAPSLPESSLHLADQEGYFRTCPERDDTDGYFAAILTQGRMSA
jgi:16S rRNA (cytosine967-C5)-methyltransferase